MPILPTGTSLPPLTYVLGLSGVTLATLALLWAVKPVVTQRTVVGFAPWMAVGGGLHAFYQLDAFAPMWEPLFGTPAVYVTTFVIASQVWLALSIVGLAKGHRFVARYLGLTGVGVLTVLLVITIYQGLGLGTIDPVWPSLAVVIALVITALTSLGISLWRTPVFVRTRYVGPLVVFGHAIDGVSTAIGTDIYGVYERSPIPRAIMDFAGDLPTAEAFGVGWLFLLVKVAVAALIVVAFNRTVEEEPFWGNVLFGFVAAVGLGPAANNLFLFFVSAP
jgi:uncharacterized membrane protein